MLPGYLKAPSYARRPFERSAVEEGVAEGVHERRGRPHLRRWSWVIIDKVCVWDMLQRAPVYFPLVTAGFRIGTVPRVVAEMQVCQHLVCWLMACGQINRIDSLPL